MDLALKLQTACLLTNYNSIQIFPQGALYCNKKKTPTITVLNEQDLGNSEKEKLPFKQEDLFGRTRLREGQQDDKEYSMQNLTLMDFNGDHNLHNVLQFLFNSI